MFTRNGVHPSFALPVLFWLACGSSSEPLGTDTDPIGDGGVVEDAGEPLPEELTAGAGKIALRVDRARQVTSSSGAGNLEVAFTLANGQGAPPAALNLALFQVKTATGLYVSATPSSIEWLSAESCDSALSVGANASYACALEFAVDARAQNVVELYYRTANEVAGVGDDRRSASAPLSVEPCVQCGEDCTYLDRSSNHCGACDNDVSSLNSENNWVSGRCEAGRAVCPAEVPSLCDVTLSDGSLASYCIDVTDNPSHCGACNVRVVDGYCAEGAPSCAEGSTSTCGDERCIDLATSNEHCGACNQRCGELGYCMPLVQSPNTPSCVAGSLVFREDVSFSDERPLPSPTSTCTTACQSIGYDGCNGNAVDCTSPPEILGNGERYLSCSCHVVPG